MTANQVDYLNIGLMGISLVAAFLLPFEVFLFSYAFLGPLHYLTEISWLHDRQYFTPKKLDWVPLVALALLLLLGAKEIIGESANTFLTGIGLGGLIDFVDKYSYSITFLSFGLAFIFVVVKDWTYRIAAIMFLLLVAYIFALPSPPLPITTKQEYDMYISKYTHPFYKVFAVYLPTLIHVYLFTGAFILFGALKRRSGVGYSSFAVFVICAIACFLVLPNGTGYVASTWAMESYKGFEGLSAHLLNDLDNKQLVDAYQVNYFTDPFSLQLARFIAFAYTYHYLNWFSKTSVIRWHKVPKGRFVVVIAAWIASIGLYLWDYGVGFRWLFLLSFLHVLLEFPLNHQSFIGIGREFRSILSGKSKAPKVEEPVKVKA